MNYAILFGSIIGIHWISKESWREIRNSIPVTPLLSLPYCTNLNIVSKNVVCRDYPSVWEFVVFG